MPKLIKSKKDEYLIERNSIYFNCKKLYDFTGGRKMKKMIQINQIKNCNN